MKKDNWGFYEYVLVFFNYYLKNILLKLGVWQYFKFCITVCKLKLLIYLYFLITHVLPASFIATYSLASIVFSVKFVILVSLLIFVRGGIPRYRYDYLTKLGWTKMLNILFCVFLSLLLMSYGL